MVFKVICGLIALLATALPAQKSDPVPPGITQEMDVLVPMRDGVQLATDVLRPDSPDRFPVLLMRTPYDKSNQSSRNEARYWAPRGFAVVVQDVRGRYRSQGEWDPFFHEADDGYDAQEWATHQAWSNGKVITYGASYLTMAQWLAATRGHAGLIGMVSNVGPHDIYEGLAYVGGAFQHGTGITWSSFMDGRESSIPAVDAAGWSKAFRYLPVIGALRTIGRDPKFYRDWASHPTYDPYWRQLRWQEQYRRFHFPIFNIGGWFDLFQKGAAENFRRMRLLGPPAVKSGHRLVIGPWTHGSAATLRPEQREGAVGFGQTSTIDLRDLVSRWLDRYAKGAENGVDREAPVKLFTMGENAWHDYQDWPVEGTKYVKYYLRSKGMANTAGGDGELSASAPRPVEKSDRYTYDPADPVPTIGGGNCCLPQVLPGGPLDQRDVENRKDVLVYSTQPLSSAVRVTGPVTVKLWVMSSALDTDFTIKLVDVQPDGFVMNLTDGILRARYRKSSEKLELLRPGRIYELTVDAGITSNLFLPGHRIRVEISSSNSPKYSRNTNTGGQPETDTNWKPAHQRILHDALHPSYLLLPVLPR